MITGPLFKWFGSKWLSSRLLPPPAHDTIVEPFAGSAGYSLRHSQKRVILLETDPHIRELWQWLTEASEQTVLEIPIGVAEGTDIRTLGLSHGQALLMKSWQRTNNVGDCWTVSPWGNKPGQWTANTRARVAAEVHGVSHWTVISGEAFAFMRRENFAATWLIDPAYEYNYQYRQGATDYTELGRLARERKGQTIVCESMCQKTGKQPAWLPFEFFGSRITSRRKKDQNHHSRELIWVSP